MGSWVYLHELCKYTYFLHNASVFFYYYFFLNSLMCYIRIWIYI